MTEPFGDAALTARAGQLLGSQHRVFAAAVVTRDRTSTAVAGAPLDADFEIGSISKGVTGLLYVDALSRGQVRTTTTLEELLPLDGSGTGRITLGSLSTHTSGLPRLAPGSHPVRRSIALWRHGTNPYGDTVDELVEQVRTVRLGRPRPSYSNIGFMLLGHAVAASAGMTYAALVRERVTAPLGLDPFYIAAAPDDLGPGALRGTSRREADREPWTGAALGPAGGIRASIGAMVGLTTALLDGTAPGVAALDPVLDFSRGVRIGAGWITLSNKGNAVTWHNGGTGGFRSWLGLDRARGVGVVVLSATSRSVDRAGFRLLEAGAGGDQGGPAAGTVKP